jgi:polyphosphate kinase 2 (PPK2 family)
VFFLSQPVKAATATSWERLHVKTSIESAPWVLVEANNKEWARIKVLRTVVRRLREQL